MIPILAALFFCHFLADYTHLSTDWMLKAKRFGKPLYPIFTHAFIHASLMLVALSIFGISGLCAMYLFLLQLITHFVIDVLKGRMNGWIPELQSPTNKWHWVVFGADQYLHSIVIVVMAYYANRCL